MSPSEEPNVLLILTEMAWRSNDGKFAAPPQSSMKDIINRIAKVELRLSQLENLSAAYREEITGLRKNNIVLMDRISKIEDGLKGGQVKGSGGRCPEDWFSFSRFCYKYNENPESWNRAEAKCQAYSPDVHLATIANCEEMAGVAKELAKRVRAKHQVWIGMHRIKGGKFPRWRWADFASADYMPWAVGESHPREKEQCVALHAESKEI
ncbi:C-type lectin BpLec-like [Podarcis raffonei]|uniref:C-type lectin BpLec-like n=1 Tax=Podarcis raffonei TaxID=65483 RepID=UPI0023293068|nr:C-type lectin BpLec-like [Podarcis raffonei]